MTTSGITKQIPLDLGHRTAYAQDDFFVSSSNARAVGLLDQWPNWSAPLVLVVGPKACGKTHMCHAHARKSGAVFFDPALDMNAFPDEVVVDDVARFAGHTEAEEKLFHLCNRAMQGAGHVMMTADKPVDDWGLALADLRSRIASALTVTVDLPDDALMAAILTKLFSDRQIFVGQEVVAYIASRCERSFAGMTSVVARIDAAALAGKRAVTIPLVKDILGL